MSEETAAIRDQVADHIAEAGKLIARAAGKLASEDPGRLAELHIGMAHGLSTLHGLMVQEKMLASAEETRKTMGRELTGTMAWAHDLMDKLKLPGDSDEPFPTV